MLHKCCCYPSALSCETLLIFLRHLLRSLLGCRGGRNLFLWTALDLEWAGGGNRAGSRSFSCHTVSGLNCSAVAVAGQAAVFGGGLQTRDKLNEQKERFALAVFQACLFINCLRVSFFVSLLAWLIAFFFPSSSFFC